MRIHRGLIAIAAIAACFAQPGAPSAEAAILTVNIGGDEFSGSTGAPDGIASNAVVLEFDDNTGNVATVKLTITFNGDAILLSSSAKLNTVSFNVTADTGTYSISPNASDAAIASVDSPPPPDGENSDGVHDFDFEIGFDKSGSGFNQGSSMVFTITRSDGPGLTADMFDAVNEGTGGPFTAAAHINEVATGASGHYAGGPSFVIPEPTTVAIWAVLGMLGLCGYRRACRAS